METKSVPIKNLVGISPDLFLVKITNSKLPGLTIILLLENKFIATSDSSFSTFIRSLTILVKQYKVLLSSAKLRMMHSLFHKRNC